MKTPEEIKKGLECCSKPQLSNPCKDCPYDECGCVEDGKANVTHDALTYIEQLEEQIMCMKIQMRGDCGCCKHRNGLKINAWAITMSKTCEECIMQESRPNWEYEGLPELPKKGASA